MKTLCRNLTYGLMVGALLALTLSRSVWADSATGNGQDGQPLDLQVVNGHVTFNSCPGVCSLRDSVPEKTGPVRSWQTFTLTAKGMRASFEPSAGKPTNYLGRRAIACFAFTPAEAQAVGGETHLKVAYWDSKIEYCDGNECGKGRWYVLHTTYENGADGREACALLRRAVTFALVANK
jgi:hypothetical protein